MRQFFLSGVLGPPRLGRHTWQCPCISVVPEATHEASRVPLKGAVSAQKALQGSETETSELLGATEENSISLTRGHWFALQANKWFFTKRKQKNIELVARPWLAAWRTSGTDLWSWGLTDLGPRDRWWLHWHPLGRWGTWNRQWVLITQSKWNFNFEIVAWRYN